MKLVYFLIPILVIGLSMAYTLPGHTVKGNIDMYGNGILNITTPVNDTDVSTKKYVDDNVVGSGLPTTGGSMTGQIDFGGFALYNTTTPVNNTDAATKQYVDTANTSMKAYVDANDTLLDAAIGVIESDYLTASDSWTKLNKTGDLEVLRFEYDQVVYVYDGSVYRVDKNGFSTSYGTTNAANNAVAIQAAIDNGRSVLLTEDFVVSTSITINDTYLIGRGNGTGISGSVSPLLQTNIDPDIHFMISDMDITITSNNIGLYIKKNDTVGSINHGNVVSHVNFLTTADTGILLQIDGGDSLSVDYCNFMGRSTWESGDGVGIYGYAHDADYLLMNPTFSHCKFGWLSKGIYVVGDDSNYAITAGVKVISCDFIGVKTAVSISGCDEVEIGPGMIDSSRMGIILDDVHRPRIFDMYIAVTSITGNGYPTAIWITATDVAVANARVSDCYLVQTSSGAGNYTVVMGGASGANLSNTVINGCSINGGGGDAAVVFSTYHTQTQIIDNKISSGAGVGISLSSATGWQADIEHNWITTSNVNAIIDAASSTLYRNYKNGIAL